MKITLKTVSLVVGICLSINAVAQRGPQGTPQERAERQVSRMKEQLALNDDQVTKINAIILARIAKTDSLRAANGGNGNGGGNRNGGEGNGGGNRNGGEGRNGGGNRNGDGASGPVRETMKTVQGMNDKFNEQINSVLTKEQADKYKQIQEEQRQNRGNRGN